MYQSLHFAVVPIIPQFAIVIQAHFSGFTCSHVNPDINYIWAAFKLHISRTFQTQKVKGAVLDGVHLSYQVNTARGREDVTTFLSINVTLGLEQ